MVYIALNRTAGLLGSVLLVWAAWTHRLSVIQPWLLSTVVVSAAIALFALCIVLPTLVKGFIATAPLGLGAASLVAAVTAQWRPAVALALGAVLASAILRSARALQKHDSGAPTA